MTLAQLQALFHGAVTGAAAEGAPPAQAWLLGSAALAADERVEIYASMYRCRLEDALRQDYPKVAALLGPDGFSAAAAAYVRAHPSEDPDLGQLGRRFAGFLEASPALCPRPDLAALARLEWCRSEVFLEAPAPAVSREALTALAPDALAAARFSPIPALRLLTLPYDAAALWRALEDGEPPPPPREEPTHLAVWREGFTEVHAKVGDAEAAAISALLREAPLGELCAAFGEGDGAVAEAFAALGSWLDEGWIREVRA